MLKLVVFSFVLLFPASAVAATIDFSSVILDQDGLPISDCTGNNCVGAPTLTLGRIGMHVLAATFDDEKNLSGEDKLKRGELALRVYKGGKIDLSVEDIALLKKLIAKGYGPMIVMRCWPLLDPK